MLGFRTLSVFVFYLMFMSGTAWAGESESLWGWLTDFSRAKEVKPISNARYQQECGACHFAYPPGLLVEASWAQILTEKALEDHFGENAELDSDTLNELRHYVLEGAADKSYFKRSRKIAYASQGKPDVIRITDVPYIRRKHHDIPEALIKGNDKVRTLSQCSACHTQAEQGNFDDDLVRIPGYGAWDK